jgi:hypothetical protein
VNSWLHAIKCKPSISLLYKILHQIFWRLAGTLSYSLEAIQTIRTASVHRHHGGLIIVTGIVILSIQSFQTWQCNFSIATRVNIAWGSRGSDWLRKTRWENVFLWHADYRCDLPRSFHAIYSRVYGALFFVVAMLLKASALQISCRLHCMYRLLHDLIPRAVILTWYRDNQIAA